MRPAVNYSLDEIMEFSLLHDRTEAAADELEATVLDLVESMNLSTKEVLFSLARVANEFITGHEDFGREDVDAEAAFNDYFLACRDLLSGEQGGGIGIEGLPQG